MLSLQTIDIQIDLCLCFIHNTKYNTKHWNVTEVWFTKLWNVLADRKNVLRNKECYTAMYCLHSCVTVNAWLFVHRLKEKLELIEMQFYRRTLRILWTDKKGKCFEGETTKKLFLANGKRQLKKLEVIMKKECLEKLILIEESHNIKCCFRCVRWAFRQHAKLVVQKNLPKINIIFYTEASDFQKTHTHTRAQPTLTMRVKATLLLHGRGDSYVRGTGPKFLFIHSLLCQCCDI